MQRERQEEQMNETAEEPRGSSPQLEQLTGSNTLADQQESHNMNYQQKGPWQNAWEEKNKDDRQQQQQDNKKT